MEDLEHPGGNYSLSSDLSMEGYGFVVVEILKVYLLYYYFYKKNYYIEIPFKISTTTKIYYRRMSG